MADKELKARIKLRYDLEENWKQVNSILKVGELAVVVDSLENPTIVKIKSGDGNSDFNSLPYISALSADVIDACKSEEALLALIEGTCEKALEKYHSQMFILCCGGAELLEEAPPLLTDEVLQEALSNSLDELLKEKF